MTGHTNIVKRNNNEKWKKCVKLIVNSLLGFSSIYSVKNHYKVFLFKGERRSSDWNYVSIELITSHTLWLKQLILSGLGWVNIKE